MNKRMKLFGIVIILVCVCLSGCDDDEDDDFSEDIEEGTFDTTKIVVYVRVNVKNDEGEEMIPQVTIDLKSNYYNNDFAYPPSGGLIYLHTVYLKTGEDVVVTAVHSEGNKTYSDTKSINFEDASNKGRRSSYTWTADCTIIVPGGTPVNGELPINVTVGCGVSVIHYYWNQSISNYDAVYKGVSDVVKIEMRGPYSKTLTFTETTTDGTVYVEGSFFLKKTEFIDVVATHQETDTSVVKSFIHDGTYSSDHYWNPEIEIYVYKTLPE